MTQLLFNCALGIVLATSAAPLFASANTVAGGAQSSSSGNLPRSSTIPSGGQPEGCRKILISEHEPVHFLGAFNSQTDAENYAKRDPSDNVKKFAQTGCAQLSRYYVKHEIKKVNTTSTPSAGFEARLKVYCSTCPR